MTAINSGFVFLEFSGNLFEQISYGPGSSSKSLNTFTAIIRRPNASVSFLLVPLVYFDMKAHGQSQKVTRAEAGNYFVG